MDVMVTGTGDMTVVVVVSLGALVTVVVLVTITGTTEVVVVVQVVVLVIVRVSHWVTVLVTVLGIMLAKLSSAPITIAGSEAAYLRTRTQS